MSAAVNEIARNRRARARELPAHQLKPALEDLQRLAGAPVLPLGPGRQAAADRDEIDGRGEARLAEVEKLLVRGESRIVRAW